jgi:AraC-like DNA-binding protein
MEVQQSSAPEAAPQQSATVSLSAARALLSCIEATGVPREQILHELRIRSEQLTQAEVRVAHTAIMNLCELFVKRSGDPALGLRWLERFGDVKFGLVAEVMANTPSLRSALETLSEFQRLFADGHNYHVVEQNGRVSIHCAQLPGASPEVQRFLAETMVLGFWSFVRSFGAQPRALQASFAYPAPIYRAQYARVFGGRERFDQSYTGISFDAGLMSSCARRSDEEVHRALRSIAQRRLLRLGGKAPYRLRVRDLLVSCGVGHVPMRQVARSLAIAERTLRRRLNEEGASYDAISKEALTIVAKELLAGAQLTIQETSARLGFSHPSAFHRAFKRATGMTPREYQLQALAQPVVHH